MTKETKPKYKIIMKGWYGVYNLGDDLTFLANLWTLQKTLPSDKLIEIYVHQNHKNSYKYLISLCRNDNCFIKEGVPEDHKFISVVSWCSSLVVNTSFIPDLLKIVILLQLYLVGLMGITLLDAVNKKLLLFYKDVDVIYYCGGGYFNGEWFHYMFNQLLYITYIKKFVNHKVRILGTGLGIGPFYNSAEEFFARIFFSYFDLIGVREIFSRDILRKINVSIHIELTYDDALKLFYFINDFINVSHLEIPKNKKIIGLNIKDFPAHYSLYSKNFIKTLISQLGRLNYKINVFLFGRKPGPDDLSVLNQVLGNIKPKSLSVLDPYTDFKKFITTLLQSRFNIGFAYHFVILSLGASIPILTGYSGPYYKQKILGALKIWECERFIIHPKSDNSSFVEISVKELTKAKSMLRAKNKILIPEAYKKAKKCLELIRGDSREY